MQENSASRLREMTREEVELQLGDLQEELQNLKLRASLKQESNPLRIREVRHDIARVKTLLREDELDLRHLARGEGQA